MKLSQLLSQRDALLLQVRLANFAFAYVKLGEFAARIERAQLSGLVCLKRPAAELEPRVATFTAVVGPQSVIEEHFTDEDVHDLADVIGFILDGGGFEITFPIEDLADTFLGPLRREFEEHGIAIDQPARPIKHG
jgi:hypothetical protein